MKVHANNILKSTLVATIGALVAVSPSLSANLTNGTFELSPLDTPETTTTALVPGPSNVGFNSALVGDTTTVTGWTAIGGAQNAGYLYQGQNRFANNGILSRTVQLNRGGAQGGISTVITGLNIGIQNIVTVFFDFSGNFNSPDPITIDVALGTAPSQQFVLGAQTSSGNPIRFSPVALPNISGAQFNLQFETRSATFIFTPFNNTAILSFISRSGESTGFGPIIDNVSLTPIPFEFSPLTGFIAGGVLFGSYKLIKRKKSVA